MKTTVTTASSIRTSCLIALVLGATRLSDASALTQDDPYARAAPASANERMWFNSVDDYKLDAARKIVRSNMRHIFDGRLPRVLPAVVVLRISVDEAGRIVDLWVQRAPEGGDMEADIALTSLYRTALLPRPLNLIDRWNRTLSFSETFLFNADSKFQLRSLAPIQTSD
jgi:protein TonB